MSRIQQFCVHHAGMSYSSAYCPSCQVGALHLLIAGGTAVGDMTYDEKMTLTYALLDLGSDPSPWGVTGQPEVYEWVAPLVYPEGWKALDEAILPHDLKCAECDEWVSMALKTDKAHWENVCGECSNHVDSGNCVTCPNCENHTDSCDCCQDCGNSSYYCECCGMCGNAPGDCECASCEDCGEKLGSSGSCGYCGSSSSHGFGKTMTPAWGEMPVLDEPLPLRRMSELDKTIDPVQSAADYYLMDAIVGLVRLRAAASNVSGLEELVRNDDMLAACLKGAERARNALVERLDREFLTYAIAACGGELRYHRGVQSDVGGLGRSAMWDEFVRLVSRKGASVLLVGAELFREFGDGNGYGGEPWAIAAEITAKRLSGKMPAWLFVDRMFTLEHNGGCFMNKVDWSTNNRLGYNLYHMRQVLDAHAGEKTGWGLLLAVASPEVSEMFHMVERRCNVLARRVGAEMAPLVPVKPVTKDSYGYCTKCGMYSCGCVE
jgi:hypothetical protein